MKGARAQHPGQRVLNWVQDPPTPADFLRDPEIQGAPPARMRLFIALPVLIVVVAMAFEGPTPAQAAPDLSSTLESLPDKLKEFGTTLEDKARAAIDHIKQKEILTKTRQGSAVKMKTTTKKQEVKTP